LESLSPISEHLWIENGNRAVIKTPRNVPDNVAREIKMRSLPSGMVCTRATWTILISTTFTLKSSGKTRA
jgi:hypothetical protein